MHFEAIIIKMQQKMGNEVVTLKSEQPCIAMYKNTEIDGTNSLRLRKT
jgi:hypothetical protein